MINNYKANMARLFKHIYFIGGCIIALVVTFLFSSGTYVLPFLAKYSLVESMIFVGAAMVLYFSAFIPVFQNPEYSDGMIKNRILCGYTQQQIFFANLLSMETAVVIMSAIYLCSGAIGLAVAGEHLTLGALGRILIFIVALMGYVALLNTISFRLTNMIANSIVCVFMFFMGFNLVMFGNAAITFSTGTFFRVARIIYNINVLGQWFIACDLADEIASPGVAGQLLLSVLVIALSVAVGLFRLSKRDLK